MHYTDHDQATWYSRCFPTKLDTNKQILFIQQKVCLRKQSDEKLEKAGSSMASKMGIWNMGENRGWWCHNISQFKAMSELSDGSEARMMLVMMKLL